MNTLEKRYIFTIIGIITSLIVGFLFSTEYLHKIRFLLSFGFMGFIYALSYIWLNKIKESFIILKIVFTFILFGIGLSSLLGIRYETPMQISKVFGYWAVFSLASSVFVYMFWISILSLKNWKLIWSIAILILPIFIVVFILNDKNIKIEMFPLILAIFYIGVVYISTYLNLFNLQKTIILIVLVFSLIFLLTVPHIKQYIENMQEIIIFIFVGYIIYHIKNIILNIKNLKSNFSQDNIKSHSELLTILAISINITIYGSILSIIPYIGTSILYRNHFKFNYINKNGVLTKNNHNKAIILSFTTFIIYITSFMFYDLICSKFYYGHSFTTLGIICNIAFWMFLSAFVSYNFSKCLFED